MEDPFLNYLSLGFLIFVIIVLFYGIIGSTTFRPRSPIRAITRMRTQFMPPVGSAFSCCTCCGHSFGFGP